MFTLSFASKWLRLFLCLRQNLIIYNCYPSVSLFRLSNWLRTLRQLGRCCHRSVASTTFLCNTDVTQPRLVYYLIGLLFIVYSLLFIVYYLIGNKRWILTPRLQTKQGISMPYPEKYKRFASDVLKWNRVFQCLHPQGWPNWARVASWFFGFMNLKAKFDLNRGAYTYFYVILMLKTSVNGKSGHNYLYLNLRILNMFSLSSMLNATTNTVDCVVWSSGLFRMMSVTLTDVSPTWLEFIIRANWFLHRL